MKMYSIVYNLPRKYRKELKDNYEALTCIQHLSEEIGYGAFAEQDIAQNEVVAEYTGIIRYLPGATVANVDSGYMWNYTPNTLVWFVDAKKAGNVTRFINHSYYPNIKIECVRYHNKAHTMYIARRKISKGEQLLANYGYYYWGNKKIPIEMGKPSKDDKIGSTFNGKEEEGNDSSTVSHGGINDLTFKFLAALATSFPNDGEK